MQESGLLTAIQREIYRHDFGTLRRRSAHYRPRRERHRRGRLSRLEEAPPVHERVSPASSGRRDAATFGPALKAIAKARHLSNHTVGSRAPVGHCSA